MEYFDYYLIWHILFSLVAWRYGSVNINIFCIVCTRFTVSVVCWFVCVLSAWCAKEQEKLLSWRANIFFYCFVHWFATVRLQTMINKNNTQNCQKKEKEKHKGKCLQTFFLCLGLHAFFHAHAFRLLMNIL